MHKKHKKVTGNVCASDGRLYGCRSNNRLSLIWVSGNRVRVIYKL